MVGRHLMKFRQSPDHIKLIFTLAGGVMIAVIDNASTRLSGIWWVADYDGIIHHQGPSYLVEIPIVLFCLVAWPLAALGARVAFTLFGLAFMH